MKNVYLSVDKNDNGILTLSFLVNDELSFFLRKNPDFEDEEDFLSDLRDGNVWSSVYKEHERDDLEDTMKLFLIENTIDDSYLIYRDYSLVYRLPQINYWLRNLKPVFLPTIKSLIGYKSKKNTSLSSLEEVYYLKEEWEEILKCLAKCSS